MTVDAIARMMDVSAVQAQSTRADIDACCELAAEYGCAAVFCLPAHVPYLRARLDALVEFCIDHELREIRLCRNDFEIFRVSGTGETAGNKTKIVGGNKKSSTRKYICPCCGMSVRATRFVNVACLDCNETLILAA